METKMKIYKKLFFSIGMILLNQESLGKFDDDKFKKLKEILSKSEVSKKKNIPQ
jgi:hypothetical protein